MNLECIWFMFIQLITWFGCKVDINKFSAFITMPIFTVESVRHAVVCVMLFHWRPMYADRQYFFQQVNVESTVILSRSRGGVRVCVSVCLSLSPSCHVHCRYKGVSTILGPEWQQGMFYWNWERGRLTEFMGFWCWSASVWGGILEGAFFLKPIPNQKRNWH